MERLTAVHALDVRLRNLQTMKRYAYQIQIQEYAEGDSELQQDVHTLNLYGEAGWELVSVSGPLIVGTRGLAFLYYFRKELAPNQKVDLSGDLNLRPLGYELAALPPHEIPGVPENN